MSKFIVVGVQGVEYTLFIDNELGTASMERDLKTEFDSKEEADCALWKFNRRFSNRIKEVFAVKGVIGVYKSKKEFFKWYRKGTKTFVREVK